MVYVGSKRYMGLRSDVGRLIVKAETGRVAVDGCHFVMVVGTRGETQMNSWRILVISTAWSPNSTSCSPTGSPVSTLWSVSSAGRRPNSPPNIPKTRRPRYFSSFCSWRTGSRSWSVPKPPPTPRIDPYTFFKCPALTSPPPSTSVIKRFDMRQARNPLLRPKG